MLLSTTALPYAMVCPSEASEVILTRLDLTTKLVDKGAITHYIPMYVCILVGGFNHLENMKVNGKDYPIYEMENKKV